MLKGTFRKNKSHLKILIALAVLAVNILLFTFLSAPSSIAAEASDNVYSTFGYGPGGKLVRTQSVYDPYKMIPLSAKAAEDFLVDGDKLFVADSDAKVIAVFDTEGNKLKEFSQDALGNNLFVSPSGIFIYEDSLYVADKGKKEVLMLNKDTGELTKTLTRPLNPLFGVSTPFVPLKVVVDKAYNVYITGEGCANGVIHINKNGEFEGFLGMNKTPVSLTSLLQSIFFSEAQKNRLLNKIPPSPLSLGIDAEGLLYTVTPNNVQGAIKRLNTTGSTISQFASRFLKTTAIDIDNKNNTYAVDSEGNIVIYNATGSMLFKFGGKDSYDRFGMLKNPVAIKVSENGDLRVLDKELGALVQYKPTDFYFKAMEAVNLYQDGFYLEAQPLWEEILKNNSSFILGYSSLARASMKQQNYSVALEQFKRAEDFGGYSDSFWQVRNEWLQKNSIWLIVTVLAIAALVTAYKIVSRKTALLAPVNGFFKRIAKVKIISQLLYSTYFVRHPLLAIEQMRYKNKLTWLPGIILFGLFILITFLQFYCMGYLWSGMSVNFNVFTELIKAILPIALLIVCNYFVSSVTNGEGKFKHVFIAASYSLTPMILLSPVVMILSHVLTFNEAIILNAVSIFMNVFSYLLMIVSIAGVHGFGFKGTFKNILLTAFCFVMVILFSVIIYLLFMQQFDFFRILFGEMFA